MDDQLSDDEHSQATHGNNGNGAAPTGEEPVRPGAADPAGTTPPGGSPPDGYSGPFYSLRFKLVVAVILVAAVAAMSWVYLRTVEDGTTPATGGQVAPGVESFRPGSGAQVQEQVSVAVELTPGWDGTLTVDGVPIPESDLTRDRQVSPDAQAAGDDRPAVVEDRLEFVPGPGKVMEELPSGETCVTANVHHRANPEQQRTFDWCFTVF